MNEFGITGDFAIFEVTPRERKMFGRLSTEIAWCGVVLAFLCVSAQLYFKRTYPEFPIPLWKLLTVDVLLWSCSLLVLLPYSAYARDPWQVLAARLSIAAGVSTFFGVGAQSLAYAGDTRFSNRIRKILVAAASWIAATSN